MKRTLIGLLLALPLTAVTAAAQAPPAAPATIAQRTSGLERHDGFLPMYLDTNRGRVLLEVSKCGEDVLYYVSYATGPGAVEIGMDRGIARVAGHPLRADGCAAHPGGAAARFRASVPAAAQNVADSFPISVIAALPVEAEEGGKVLVDATTLTCLSFVMQNVMHAEEFDLGPRASAEP